MSKVRCANKNCKKYIEKESAVRRGMVSYCSDECLYQRPQAKRKTSTSKTAKRSKVAEIISGQTIEQSIVRDGNRCRVCGKNSGNLAVHHIFYRSDWDNKPWQEEASNKITLCNEPCHLTIVHGNKAKYQPLLLGLIWVREIEGKNITLEQLEKRLSD
jgi:hypothetical protein